MVTLQYRGTVWICRQLCQDTAIPIEACHPVPLFVFIMKREVTWGAMRSTLLGFTDIFLPKDRLCFAV